MPCGGGLCAVWWRTVCRVVVNCVPCAVCCVPCAVCRVVEDCVPCGSELCAMCCVLCAVCCAQVKNQAIPRVRLVAQNVLINTFT